MCGRYGLYDISESELLQQNKGYNFKPNYNIAPTQSMPVITEEDGSEFVKVMQWGIHRNIGPDIEKSIFNTRSEKAFERFWGKTVRTQRCIVPANGFYEWKNSSDGKRPYWIHSPSDKLIYFAGIYDTDNEGKETYSIMTTGPNAEMSALHNRMPVILNTQERTAWLQASEKDEGLLHDLLKPLPDNSLDIYEVTKEVNYVRNNFAELIKPLNRA